MSQFSFTNLEANLSEMTVCQYGQLVTYLCTSCACSMVGARVGLWVPAWGADSPFWILSSKSTQYTKLYRHKPERWFIDHRTSLQQTTICGRYFECRIICETERQRTMETMDAVSDRQGILCFHARCLSVSQLCVTRPLQCKVYTPTTTRYGKH